jgi:hypothetical protein
VLAPNIDYTVKDGYLTFDNTIDPNGNVYYVREFNHAVNVDRYSQDVNIGEVLYSVRSKGDTFIELGTAPKLVRKTAYPELYAILGDKYTLNVPAAAVTVAAEPNGVLDVMSNPFANATSNTAPSPLSFSATTQYNATDYAA